MQPIVVLVGRPNVGKSTLFNRLTRTRGALVADVPGLTRDRLYGQAELGGRTCTVVDTGGLMNEEDALADRVTHQVRLAIDEADLVLFMVDGRAGVMPGDVAIADVLRRANVPTLLVANKVDEANSEVEATALAESSLLGFGAPLPVSAAHGTGCDDLADAVAAQLPPADDADGEAVEGRVRLAVVGRPNVGKSTLVNRWLGEERQIVSDTPGTTRDSVAIPFTRGDDEFLLIDTAGVRRRGRSTGVIEKFSVVKTLEAIRTSDVVVLLIDAFEGLVDQDLHLLGYAIDVGTGLVLALNKWDRVDEERGQEIAAELARRLDFAPWIPLRRMSAKNGMGVRGVLDEVVRVARARRFEATTTYLNRVLGDAVTAHQPPSPRGRRIKLRFVHKSGANPPRIVIHGNQTKLVPIGYTRYLERCFREAVDLTGTPFLIEYETSDNPYAGRRNELSPRQKNRRKRVIAHRKTRERKPR